MLELVLVLTAAFCGGVLNAAAGGGTFLTLPALIFVGVPPVAANATSAVAFLPGYAASAWGFREDMQSLDRRKFWQISLAALLGGAVGALLLVITPDKQFREFVPWLMLIGTLWFALGPWLDRKFRHNSDAGLPATLVGIFAVSAYGGYFSGGSGIMILALLGALGFGSLNFMNGLKNLVSAILYLVALIIYVLADQIVWYWVIVMTLATVAGGYVGARWARKLPETWLRMGVTAVGALVTIAFFAR